MRKLKKIQLNFSKEVVSRLSNDDLSQLKGGGFGDGSTKDSDCCTFNSYCICGSDIEYTCPNYTKGTDCQIAGETSSNGPICCPLPTQSTPGGNCPAVTLGACDTTTTPSVVPPTTEQVSNTTLVQFTTEC